MDAHAARELRAWLAEYPLPSSPRQTVGLTPLSRAASTPLCGEPLRAGVPVGPSERDGEPEIQWTLGAGGEIEARERATTALPATQETRAAADDLLYTEREV